MGIKAMPTELVNIEVKKWESVTFCPYLRQILIDF